MLVACAPIQLVTEANAQPATGDSEAITAAVNASWEDDAASLNAGDPNRWIAQWTEEGIPMPPGMPANVGEDRHTKY